MVRTRLWKVSRISIHVTTSFEKQATLFIGLFMNHSGWRSMLPLLWCWTVVTASDLNDWRMELQQEIRERRQVLREAHQLQRTELLQKLRYRCREPMDRPCEREIQELRERGWNKTLETTERPGIQPKSTLTTWVVSSHVQNGAADRD